MSIVCKKLYAHLNRVLICCRPTMVVSPFNSGRLPFNQRPSSPLPTIIREVEGDLFTARRDTSLAHCVSSDMKMGAGIAVHFRAKFGRVDDLLSQKKTVGEVAYLKDSQRFIFYLVTKKRYFHKPTEKTLHRSLLDMRDKCQKLGVTKLAMPRIGCGLDGLKWPSVFHLLKEVFENCGIEITIYSIPDKKRKSVTPHLNKSQENFRKFFEPKEPHSLPENAMNSKRKFHTDSLEENSYMPKRMKHLTVSSHDRKFIAVDDFDARSPSKKKSSANLSSETSLSFIHREADLGSDNLDAEALSSFSGDCPFQSSPKKRNITVSSQDRKPVADGYFHAPSPSKKKSSAKRSSEASFPTTCREVDLEYDKFDIEALSTFSGDCPFLTSPTKSPQTNNNLELSEENSIHLPDQKRAKSISSSPCRENMEVTTAPSSSKKHKRRSSSKSHSEEKVKKERKTRSASKSHSEEKAKKEKRRSSSKSRSEEKSEKKKRRSSSKSSSREKVKKEKRRSSKNCSEEKLKKEKHRSYGIVMGPLDSDSSESSQAKAHVVSERFPSFNKRRPSKDLSDSFDESAEMKRTSFNVTFPQDNANRPRSKSSLDLPSDEDTVYRRRETKKERLASPHKGSSHKHSRQLEKSQEDTTMRKPFNSTEMDRFPYQSKGRWVEMARTSSKDDDSLYKKMKTTPDKPFRKAPNSAVGRMYSDKETSNVSVKKRLSLGR